MSLCIISSNANINILYTTKPGSPLCQTPSDDPHRFSFQFSKSLNQASFMKHPKSFEIVPCLCCRKIPSERAHIKTVGSGSGNEWHEVMPLCRTHHQEQHTIGIVTFIRKYHKVWTYIDKAGWTVDTGKLRRK